MAAAGEPPSAPGGPPWQFIVRAVMVVTGLGLLLGAKVHGAVFYVAWGLIVLALVTEAVATGVHFLRARRGS